MNHQYPIQIVWSEEDGAYLATAAGLPGCRADGETPEQALANLKVVMEEWMQVAKEDGRAIPPPLTISQMNQIAEAQFKARIQQSARNAIETAAREVFEKLTAEQAEQASTTYMRILHEPEFSGFRHD